MPIIKSAKKSIRQSLKRQKRNKQKKDSLKTLLKQAESLIKEKKPKEAKELLPKIYKALDKSAKSNIIKKNKAGRKKSRITKRINKS